MIDSPKFKIEIAVDVREIYERIEIFLTGEREAFMEISIDQNKKMHYIFYNNSKFIDLSNDDLIYIMNIAADFYPKAIERGGDHTNIFN